MERGNKKTPREQAFRIREPELRVREQENQPGTGELIITCVYNIICTFPTVQDQMYSQPEDSY